MWSTSLTLACGATVAAFVLIPRFVQLRRQRRKIRLRSGAHTATRPLGPHSGVRVTVLGQGGAPIGDLYKNIDDVTALTTIATAHENQIQFFDTSPWYGVGLSEMRVGLALHRLQRSSFVVQTKVGRYLVPDRDGVNGTKVGWVGGLHMGIRFDYSGAAFERQLEDSLQRTGLGHIDSLVIHDLEPTPHRDVATGDNGVATACRHLETLNASGFAALQRMRAEGRIRAFGAGINIDEDGEDPETKRLWNREYFGALMRMQSAPSPSSSSPPSAGAPAESLARGLDFVLLANMHSLLNNEANELGILDECAVRGVSVVVGGPFSTGILATGADPPGGAVPNYNYLPASDRVRAHTRRLESVCKRHGVPLIAAALQYPLRHPAVSCVIPGGASPREVASNVVLMNVPIPEALWRDMEAEMLLPPPVGLR